MHFCSKACGEKLEAAGVWKKIAMEEYGSSARARTRTGFAFVLREFLREHCCKCGHATTRGNRLWLTGERHQCKGCSIRRTLTNSERDRWTISTKKALRRFKLQRHNLDGLRYTEVETPWGKDQRGNHCSRSRYAFYQPYHMYKWGEVRKRALAVHGLTMKDGE